jgi:DNA-directed RNA polymerase specialized sigma24 family protein
MQEDLVAHNNTAATFSKFMEETEPRLRRALIAGYGSQLGRDATIEAFEYGWEHWDRVSRTRNPAGYLYRVGANCAGRNRRKMNPPPALPGASSPAEPWVEPKLDGALDGLSRSQRTAVVLIHGFNWTYAEVADLLSVRRSTVQRHVSRAMGKLRAELGVHDAVA